MVPGIQILVTFDIVKLGIAYDKNQLSAELKDKLKPYIKPNRLFASQLVKSIMTKSKFNLPKIPNAPKPAGLSISIINHFINRLFLR